MSKWSKYNNQIDSLISKGRTDWSAMARDILEDKTSEKIDLLRTYIKRRSNKGVSVSNKSKTKDNDYETPYVLSAWRSDGTIMDIEEYCSHHRLPRENITSWKLITHSKEPYYNCVFKEIKEDVSVVDYKEIIDNLLPIKVSSVFDKENTEEEVTRVVYTDTHIGMETDSDGSAMYAEKWNEKTITDTLTKLCAEVIKNKVGNTLYIDDLGDFLDGWNAQTVRGGHSLPQNMSNKEAFKFGLEFKVGMIETLIPHFDRIVCHNVCIDNHSGSFSDILNHSFKRIIEAKYDNVSVVNLSKFMGHHFIGKHCFVLCHGKDDKNMKYGFKVKLDPQQIEKIDLYLKHNEDGNIYKRADYIWFDKGDSHQMLFDYSTAQDFNYMNYPALSPSSEFVGINYKKGRRGFVVQQIHPTKEDIKIIPVTL